MNLCEGHRDPSGLFLWRLRVISLYLVWEIRTYDSGDRGQGKGDRGRGWRGSGWVLDSTYHIHSSDPHTFPVRGSTCHEDDSHTFPVGIRYARVRPRSLGSFRITISGLCPSSAWHRITRSIFGGTVESGDTSSRIMSLGGAAMRLREIMNEIRNKRAPPHGRYRMTSLTGWWSFGDKRTTKS
ncbi:hypothetical protein PIB30_066479 [Stylosanthes scabra]|uniref:Uncharacterized protein n=1 Tax=Stylosanthes scabra TaxID=79078 RepID=A0ABU6ZL13_9FABA|nr:hypothetical protein [Stylosanthes scabra]